MGLKIVGTSPSRDDALAKAMGKAIYVDDMAFEGLYVRAYRSKTAHARVKHIDASKAKNIPGIKDVITYWDIPGIRKLGPMVNDQPVLVKDRIRHPGEPLVLVVGEMNATEEALEHIHVDLEELPPVLDAEEAIDPDTCKIHDGGNILGTRVIQKGDVEMAIEQADIVVSNFYSTQMVEHAYLEPDVAIAFWREGLLDVFASTQYPHQDRDILTKVLNIDEASVRVRQMLTGGGFGGKIASKVVTLAGLAAWKTQESVKMLFDRQEVFDSTTKRHPFKIWYTTAATRDGKITAIKVKILGDTGAYCIDGSAVLTRAAVHACGPYSIPNGYVEAITVYTNRAPAAAMRGYGCPQITFAIENQMDILAEKLGMDPFDLRLKNCLRIGDETLTGQMLEHSVGIAETIDCARQIYDGMEVFS